MNMMCNLQQAQKKVLSMVQDLLGQEEGMYAQQCELPPGREKQASLPHSATVRCKEQCKASEPCMQLLPISTQAFPAHLQPFLA